jgi:hypothetical protein
MVLYTVSMLFPFNGGNNSNEKAVVFALLIFSTTLMNN